MWMMVALVAGAFAIRIRNLGVSDLTFDEAASAFISAKPYPEMVKYLLGAFHELPPAYYMLLRAWEFFAGRSEFALRYPSVISGVLSVALLYRLGRRGLGIGVGLIAATVLALQPFHAYYSQDARMYTLLPLEALVVVYFFDRLCHELRWRWWLALGATGILAVLTHYFMGYMIAALCVYLLLHARAHRRMLLPWFGGLAAAGGVMAIWLLTSRAWRLVRRVLSGISWPAFVDRLTAPVTQQMLADLVFGPFKHLTFEWRILIAALITVGLLVAMLSRRWRTLKPGGAWLLPAWLLIPTFLLIVIPERLEARYNAAVVPAYCLVLALAIAWLWQKKYTRPLAPVALGLLLYAQMTTLVPTMNVIKSNYGRVIAYLHRHVRPGDSLILNGDWQWVQLLYYPAPQMPTYRLPPGTPPGLDPAQARPELEKALAASQRIWLLPAAVEQADPQRFVMGWLNEHAYPTSDYHELTLYTVGRSSATPIQLDPPVTWDDMLQLESVRWVQSQAVPGEPLLLDLNWKVLRTPQRDLRFFVGLADRDGGVWYSNQVAPGMYYAPPSTWQAGERRTTRIGLPIPLGAPPGTYDVRVNVIGLTPSTGGDYAALPGAVVLPCSAASCSPMFEGEDFTPLRVTFGDDLMLVGYQVAGVEFFQGRFAAVTLYWQAEHPLADELRERVVLVDRAGREVSPPVEGPPVAAWFPASQWPPGQVLADPRLIFVPPRLAPGDYLFRVSLSTSEGQALPVAGRDWLDVTRVRIAARDRQFRMGRLSHPLQVEFGGQVRLLGYDVEPRISSGEIKLTLHWQAVRVMDEGYTVFRHVIGPDGRLAGQKDSWPCDGDYPTSFWMRGEVVTDESVIPFSTGAGSGEYRIELGLYDSVTGQRLPAISNGARLVNDAVVISMELK